MIINIHQGLTIITQFQQTERDECPEKAVYTVLHEAELAAQLAGRLALTLTLTASQGIKYVQVDSHSQQL